MLRLSRSRPHVHFIHRTRHRVSPTSPLSTLEYNNKSLTPHPNDILTQQHHKWLIQKYLMQQDVILMGPPTSYRRQLIMMLAKAKNWDIEYLAITRDTTESDLKQRRDIIGDTVVYVDQPPVRAAIHGRVLVLDGLENAERNVLPTLNNLLENREMSLDDGRFLMRKPNNSNIERDLDKRVVFVHDNFRVVGLSVPVPSYSGRLLDPPLRSRFQCRFIDEPPSEYILSLVDTSKLSKEKLLSLVQCYESLRGLRESSIEEDTTLSSLPMFSQYDFQDSIRFLKKFPEMTLQEVIGRYVPSTTWMSDVLPDRFRHPIEQISKSMSENSSMWQRNDKSKFCGSSGNCSYDLKSVNYSEQNNERMARVTFSPKSYGADEVEAWAHTGNVQDIRKHDAVCENLANSKLLPSQRKLLSVMAMDHAMGQHMCILGPKGCGKSIVAREFSKVFGYACPRVFPLYRELTARDLLQRRITDQDGNTTWADSPLVRAAREGNLCVLDGVHALDTHALGSLRRLLHDGVVDLPDGERLTCHASFRVIGLGLPASTRSGGDSRTSLSDSRLRYVSSDLGWTYHALAEGSTSEILKLLEKHIVERIEGTPEGTSMQQQYLRGITQLNDVLHNLAEISGSSHPELKPSFRHALNISNSLLYLGEDSPRSYQELRSSLENAFLIRYMPGAVAEKFEDVMRMSHLDKKSTGAEQENLRIHVDNESKQLSIGHVKATIASPTDIEKVPRPLFYENDSHTQVLQKLLSTHTSKINNSFLLIGNQGVGKNKLVDYMLSLLNREREYVQLHRDTTVQSLTVLPSLQEGKIVYEDSPLLRAAKSGTVLVIDEADKAPVEVVSILKMLVEDGELVLYDGRRLLSSSRLLEEGFQLPDHMVSVDNEASKAVTAKMTLTPCPPEIIPIHPAFRLIVLANRPGFPFHGNNLFRECGDIFSVHVVENLDLDSEIALLHAYAPDVPVETIRKIALSFQDLRAAYENQELSYPYSAREAVSVVKHLQVFPEDGVQAAVEDILSFEGFNPRNRKQIAIIFQRRGLPIPIQPPLLGDYTLPNLSSDHNIDTSVFLTPMVPLPAAEAFDFKSGGVSQCQVNTHSLRSKQWASNHFDKKTFQIDPSRLFTFSEEIGCFYVGDQRKMKNRNAIVDMISDEVIPNALHVLTRYPLELYSFYPSDSFGDGGSGYCIRRELVDEEIHWRFGDPEGILGGLSGGGATVYLALIARNIPDKNGSKDIEVLPVESVQMSLIDQEATNKKKNRQSAFGYIGDTLFSFFGEEEGMKRNEQTAEELTQRKQAVKALYKEGQNVIQLIDVATPYRRVHNVTLPSTIRRISNVRRTKETGHCSENSNVVWNVSGSCDRGKEFQVQGLLNFNLLTGEASFVELNARKKCIENSFTTDTSTGSKTWKAESLSHSELNSPPFLMNDKGFLPTHTAMFGGSEASHGCRMSVNLGKEGQVSGQLLVWPRSESIGRDTSPQKNKSRVIPASGDQNRLLVNATVPVRNNVIYFDEHSFETFISGKEDKRMNDTSSDCLDVCDLDSQQLRVLELTKKERQVYEQNDSDDYYSHTSPPSVKAIVSLPNLSSDKCPSVVAVLDSDGRIRLFESDPDTIGASLERWKNMLGVGVKGTKFAQESFSTQSEKDGNLMSNDRDGEGHSDPRFGVDKPKHGKEDSKNEPHVGGNTWAGGTGGSDTAGLGGRGGPYRLDKGHKVHQVSDKDKQISAEAKARAAAMAKEAFDKRMQDIKMGKQEFENYEYIRNKIQQQANQLRQILEELNVRSQERVWLKNQTHGELDDSKLVDGLTGDRMVFKRRGVPEDAKEDSGGGNGPIIKKRLQFIMDVSGSMYRFNSRDKRLERMLEAALLIMTAMPSPGDSKGVSEQLSEQLEYAITGHSGDSDHIKFVPFGSYDKVKNEKKRLQILQEMIAHTQFCMSGDNTLEAASRAVRTMTSSKGDKDGNTEVQYQRYAFVLSDANFERYGITPGDIRRVMHQDPDVEVHFIFIATLGDEADRLMESLPRGRVHMCYESTDLPAIFKKILTAYGGALHV